MIVCVSVYWLGLEQMNSLLVMLGTGLNSGNLLLYRYISTRCLTRPYDYGTLNCILFTTMALLCIHIQCLWLGRANRRSGDGREEDIT